MNLGEAEVRAQRVGSHNEQARAADSARCASPKCPPSAGQGALREAPPVARKLGVGLNFPLKLTYGNQGLRAQDNMCLGLTNPNNNSNHWGLADSAPRRYS